MRDFTDDNFEIYENSRKLSYRVENTVEKGEIARSSNFSFPRSIFKRLVLHTRKNQGLFGKGLTNFKTCPLLDKLHQPEICATE